MPKTNRKYCTPPKKLREWLEQEAQRLNINESAILVQALDHYRWQQEAMKRGRPQSKAVTPPKILYFEDDKFMAAMYATKLEMNGFVVRHHEHPPKDVVELATRENPDLIFMDILMPVMDGFTATKLLKADPRTKHIPVFGMSNLGQRQDIKKALDLGMVDYWVSAEHMPGDVVEKFRSLLNPRG